MGLNFILSRKNTDHTSHVNNQLVSLANNPSVDKAYYLIPDNLKFESEVNVLKHIKQENNSTVSQSSTAMIDLQVYSFSRLAWHLLNDTELFKQTRLSDIGLNILVKKIMMDLESNSAEAPAFDIFASQQKNNGFVDKMTTLLKNLRSGLIEPADLDDMLANLKEGSDTYRKLSDLKVVYEHFQTNIQGKYLEHEDIMKALIEKIHTDATDFENTAIVIDHYENFSSIELELIDALMKHAKDVYIYLTLDKGYQNEVPSENHLFYIPGKTNQSLFNLAKQAGVDITTEVIPFGAVDLEEDILKLEDYWYHNYTDNNLPNYSLADSRHIQIDELITIQDEIQYVTNQIRHLIKEGYRYKDIVVLSRDIGEYKNIVKPLFREANIPIFFSVKDTMSHHPLAEFVISTLSVVKNNFQYEDIMRFLRSELYIPSNYDEQTWRTMVDETENVILAYGYKGSAWTQQEDWIYDRIAGNDEDQIDGNEVDPNKKGHGEEKLQQKLVIQEQANQVRREIKSIFEPLLGNEKDLTTREAITQLYSFIDSNGVKAKINLWCQKAEETGEHEAARHHQQAWNTFTQLLDEYVEILGETTWDIDEFLTLVETAFETAEFSIVPPTLDQVTVTDMNQSRAGRNKIVFYIGMNESALPQPIKNSSLLDDNDINTIQDHLASDNLKSLTLTTSEKLASEPFQAYRAFAYASDYLYFSYSRKQEGENDHSLSPYLKQISNDLDIRINHQQKLANIAETGEYAFNIGSKNQLLDTIIQIKRLEKDNFIKAGEAWNHYQDKFKNDPTTKHIFSSLSFKNIPESLGEEIAKQLYGNDLYLSVSQLETFYKDPYSHFLSHGLRLHEREKLELTPAESGSYFHDILNEVFKELGTNFKETENNIELLKDLNGEQVLDDKQDSNEEEQFIDYVTDAIKLLSAEPKYKILNSSKQMEFIKTLLDKTIKRRLIVTHEQLKHTDFIPHKTEVSFGMGENDKVSSFDLNIDKKVYDKLADELFNKQNLYYSDNVQGKIQLRGKIDRIDTLSPDENDLEAEKYMQIVDYKSSKTTIEFPKLKTGLSLQLLTYVDMARKLNPGFLPISAVYSKIKLETLDYSDRSIDEVIKTLKNLGIFIDNQTILETFDNEDKNRGYSKHYNLLFSDKGIKTTSRNHKLYTPDEFDLMIDYNNELIKFAGQTILSGNLILSPFKGVPYTETAPKKIYHPISQFDDTLDENNYRLVPKDYKLEDHLTHIQELLNDVSDMKGDESDA